MDIIAILIFICATLVGLLGWFLCITGKGNHKANLVLGIFLLFWALDLLDGLLLLKGFYLDHPAWALWIEPAVLLYGPLLYVYILYSLQPKFKITARYIWHLIPYVITLTGIITTYHASDTQTQLEILESIIEFEQPFESILVVVGFYLHFIIYLVMAKNEVSGARKRIERFYSNHNLSRYHILLNIIFAFMVLSTISSTFQLSGARYYFELSIILILLSVSLFTGYIILKALEEPSILVDLNHSSLDKTSISLEELQPIADKILWALSEKELYLNPKVTLRDLADNIAVSSRKTSKAINDHLGKTFFDLINSYRIEHAKRSFKENDDPKLTVLEVMYQVGFNSKSSFNTQFKKKTGFTPSEFLRINS